MKGVDPLTAHCSECGARPGDPCLFLPLAGGPDRYTRSRSILARQALTGTPTKRPHNHRRWSEEHRLREWLRHNGSIFWELS